MEGAEMDRRRLVMTGVVAGSVGLGGLIGAIAFSPGLGLASDGDLDRPVLTVCGGAAAETLDATADAIGIQTSELLSALHGGRTIAEVAEAHDVPVGEVVDAIVAAEQDRLDQLVADGRLTREQADAFSTDLEERATDLVNGDLAPFPLLEPGLGPGVFGPPGPFGRPGFIAGRRPWGFVDGPLAAAADVIGIDERALLAAVAGGDTVADVARAHEVAVSEVVDAIVSSLQARLDQPVRDGLITQEEADRLAADLEAKATDLVNGEHVMFELPGWRWSDDPGSDTSTSELSLF
jgi:polyhydroxyalkanoate synthesis regulator phasin